MHGSIDSDRDAVVLALPSRGQFLPLTVKWDAAGLPAERDMAVVVAEALRDKADEAEDWVKAGGRRHLVTAERRVGVDVRDDKVVLVLDAPAATLRLPFEAARDLADKILRQRFNLLAEVQARAGVRYSEDHPELRK